MTEGFAWLEDAAVKRVISAYEKAGHELRFVGGCVRDSLLGRPVTDLDACSPCPPELTMTFLKEAGIKVIPTGIDHGTITAITNGRPFEITTLRKDTSCDGRHAEVAFTTDYAEDAARRDFTMNALYCDAAANITDFHDGIADAKAGRIHFIGDASDRIQEDGLRMLRLFRFYATHGKASLAPEALEACRAHAAMLQQLSSERIQQEMVKLLKAPAPYAALSALQSCALDTYLWKHALPLDALATLLPLEAEYGAPPDAMLRLACILGEDKAAREAVITRWKLSNKDATRLTHFCYATMEGDAATWAKAEMILHGRDLAIATALCVAARGEMPHEMLRNIKLILQEWEIPTFPISGKDLIALGMAQGEDMGTCIKALKQKWADSDYTVNKEELLKHLGQ